MEPPPVQVRLAQYVEGVPGDDAWTVTHDPTPDPADGEVEIDVQFVSVDPGMKGWSTPIRSYIAPVEPGEVMRAFGIGPVVRSASKHFAVGDVVTGFTGVQSRAVVGQGWLRPVDVGIAPPELHLSVLGMTGFTGYFGMLDIGRPRAGQTVVVSAASGAVGSVAAQIAKREGARVMGIAGGPEKCAYLTDDLGLDGAIDYKAGPVADRLKAETPDGIDVYFDNVGGEILDAALMRINQGARIVLCGGISQYADMAEASGPDNYLQLISKSGTMRGFTMMDYMHRIPEAFADLSSWVADGSLHHRQHIIDGLENFPEAFRMLFRGDNVGKLLLRVEGGDRGA
jgi:NADPH-dependent curcumin reductase CurA